MFTLSQQPLLLLDTQGLEDPPPVERFSTELGSSYFAQAGVDVSCIWIDAQTYIKAMAQHEANFETPTLVTVREISDLMMGPVPGKRIVYWKSIPVPDPEAPTQILRGAEATWQYLWPADKGDTYGMITIWRSGFDAPQTLERGFDALAKRFAVQGKLDGLTLYELETGPHPRGIMISGIGLSDGAFPWGRISPPTLNDDWLWRVQIDHSQAPEFTVGIEVLDLDLRSQIQQIDAFAAEWGDVFTRFAQVLEDIKTAARDALAADHTKTQGSEPWSVVLEDVEVGDDLRSLRAYVKIDGASEFFNDYVVVTLGPDGTIVGTEAY